MTQEVKMMVGIAGSGKSTWIKQEVAHLDDEHRTSCVISRDYVRASLRQPGETYFAREDEVFKEFIRQINEAMEIGFDVVFIDATHINFPSRNKVLSRLLPDPHTNLTFDVIKVPVATALNQNAQRSGDARIPNSAIQKMARSFTIPNLTKEVPEDKWGFNNIKVVIHERKD